jgi:hypothetical protein
MEGTLMATAGLRAVALALFGIGIPASAWANGLVENAQQFFFADLTDSFEESIEYLEAYNTYDGAVAIAELHELTQDMAASTYQIEQSARALAPSLGDAWSPTQRSMDGLSAAAGAVKAQVGREQVRLDALETAYDTAGSELLRSYAFMQDFGKKYAAMMSGPVENAKALHAGAVRDAYETAVEYLENYNTIDGKAAVDNLATLANRLVELSQAVKENAEDLSPTLLDIWGKDTYFKINELAIEAGVLSTQVGRMAYSLDKLKAAYGTAGSSLDRSYAELKSFGEKLAAICDTCR